MRISPGVVRNHVDGVLHPAVCGAGGAPSAAYGTAARIGSRNPPSGRPRVAPPARHALALVELREAALDALGHTKQADERDSPSGVRIRRAGPHARQYHARSCASTLWGLKEMGRSHMWFRPCKARSCLRVPRCLPHEACMSRASTQNRSRAPLNGIQAPLMAARDCRSLGATVLFSRMPFRIGSWAVSDVSPGEAQAAV